jgi:hypothetical protein
MGLLIASPLPTFSPLPGVTEPIFGPALTVTPAPVFDLNYAAAGSVLHIHASPDPTTYVMFYEGENWFFCHDYDPSQCSSSGPTTFWASIGYGTSTNGVIWQNTARVIDAVLDKPTSPPSPAGGYGTFVPTAIVAGGKFYVFYANGLQNGSPVTIHVARAPTPAPNDTTTPTFHKFFNGDWTEPGLGGRGSSILPVFSGGNDTNPCGAPQRQPGISWNKGLGVYFLTYICDWYTVVAPNTSPTNQGPRWFYSTTFDLGSEVWTAPLPMLQTVVTPSGTNLDFFAYHPTLISPNEVDQQTTDQSGYMFCSLGLPGGVQRQMHYRSICITNSAHPTC